MNQPPIVIVGAGFAGAATAWHLARRGVSDVVVLEMEATPGVHSSGRNACLIREHVREAVWQPLTTEGAAFLREATLAEYRATGSMLLGLGTDDVAPRFPRARGRGRWCPADGLVDVAALLAAYLRGVDVRYGWRLERWERTPEGLGLTTNRGPLLARVLVNAAGPWAGEVGDLPLTPLNRHVFVTAPMPEIGPDWPFVWDVEAGFYFRPESGGLLLSPCDETPAAPGDYREEEAQLERLATLVETRQPLLGDLQVAYRWVGQRTFAPDRAPAVGADPREPRLVHVAGLGGHGVTGSYALGRLAAEAVLGTPPPGAYAPGRLVSRH